MKFASIPGLLRRLYHAERAYRSTRGASLSTLQEGLQGQVDLNIDRRYQAIVLKRIAEAYNKAVVMQSRAPEPYQPGSKWKPQIEHERREYIQALKKQDLPRLTTLFENFFRNSGALSILKKNLYPQLTRRPPFGTIAQKEYVAGVLHDVNVWKEYFGKSTVEDLKIPAIGNPFGYPIDGVIVTGSSASLNYYARRSNAMLAEVADAVVAEIGSGFGGLFYYLMKENPKAICLDFDLPEVLVMAQYFLMMAYPQKRFLLFGEPGSEDRLSAKTMQDFDIILMPNYKLVDLDDDMVDLFLNFHSLSEMDPVTIAEYIRQITRVSGGFFFHENSQVARQIGYGKLEVPVEKYPISPQDFKLLYKMTAIWSEPRYMEFLYIKCKRVG